MPYKHKLVGTVLLEIVDRYVAVYKYGVLSILSEQRLKHLKSLRSHTSFSEEAFTSGTSEQQRNNMIAMLWAMATCCLVDGALFRAEVHLEDCTASRM
jgi:hypothetical protein